MVGPVNIFRLSRIGDERAFHAVFQQVSGKHSEARNKYHEMDSLKAVADLFFANGITIANMDGFFFSFEIPQIGKEFDLLKMTERVCVNIELKSRRVPEEQIRQQLLRNRYYLTHLEKRLGLFTVVTDTMEIFKLSLTGELLKVGANELVDAVKEISSGYLEEIESLFRLSEYLVSPISTPQRFIMGEYFLTQAQENVKRSMLGRIEKEKGAAFLKLTGKPGTGKTLLLYDMAKTLAKNGRTLIIHCGRVTESHNEISRCVEHMTIVSAKEMPDLRPYAFILVDESQRIGEKDFDHICQAVRDGGKTCVFSIDPELVLSPAERDHDIEGRIMALVNEASFELCEKIRMNKDLASYIMWAKNLGHRPKQPMDYSCVILDYAATSSEAQDMIEYYREKGYVFINYSRSEFDPGPFDEYVEDYDTHHVIGQEFDRVVMLLDKSFYYDDEGILQGVPRVSQDYLYPNLFYQGISRVREKLAIIVVGNEPLFGKMAGIFEENYRIG